MNRTPRLVSLLCDRSTQERQKVVLPAFPANLRVFRTFRQRRPGLQWIRSHFGEYLLFLTMIDVLVRSDVYLPGITDADETGG